MMCFGGPLDGQQTAIPYGSSYFLTPVPASPTPPNPWGNAPQYDDTIRTFRYDVEKVVVDGQPYWMAVAENSHRPRITAAMNTVLTLCQLPFSVGRELCVNCWKRKAEVGVGPVWSGIEICGDCADRSDL